MPLEELEGLVPALNRIADAINGGLETETSSEYAYDDFTDGGGASGYVDIDVNLPAGAVLENWKLKVTEAPTVSGIAGETSLKLLLGTAGDTDRCNQAADPEIVLATGLPTSAVQVPGNPVGAGDGDRVFTTTTQLRLTALLVGGTPDFGNLASGKFIVVAQYRKTAAL